MTIHVAIVADSHIPSRASRIPASFRDRIAEADHVLHAGDFVSSEALVDVRELATELTAVRGNMDRSIDLPAVETITLGGVEFVLTHGTGAPEGWADRVSEAAIEHATIDAPVAVAGHTHEVEDTRANGIRVLNPGSVTGAAPASRTTMYTAEANDGDLTVTLHEH